MSAHPLEGRRVLVTRASHQAGKLSEGLRALGATPVEVPVLEIRPPATYEPLDASLRQIERYDWLILTSANTVRVVVERAAALGLPMPSTAAPSGAEKGQRSLQIAAIGNVTAAAAREAGLPVALVPDTYVAESLVAELAGKILGKRVLIAQASITRDIVPEALRAAGASVGVVYAYRNALPEEAPENLRRAWEQGIDAATFTSSSSVTHLAEAARLASIAFPLEKVPAISIGPITSKTLREHGWEPAAEASPFDIPGLVAAAARFFNSRPSH